MSSVGPYNSADDICDEETELLLDGLYISRGSHPPRERCNGSVWFYFPKLGPILLASRFDMRTVCGLLEDRRAIARPHVLSSHRATPTILRVFPPSHDFPLQNTPMQDLP
jgi:hypothetical protein